MSIPTYNEFLNGSPANPPINKWNEDRKNRYANSGPVDTSYGANVPTVTTPTVVSGNGGTTHASGNVTVVTPTVAGGTGAPSSAPTENTPSSTGTAAVDLSYGTNLGTVTNVSTGASAGSSEGETPSGDDWNYNRFLTYSNSGPTGNEGETTGTEGSTEGEGDSVGDSTGDVKVETGENGDGGSTGEEPKDETPTDDYQPLKDNLQTQKDAAYLAAEEQRKLAEQNAELARKKGVIDANASYELQKSAYGANAESMANMGLTGSGYSDYLMSRAYAQQRSDIQAINAQAETAKREAAYAETQAKLDADASYAANMNEIYAAEIADKKQEEADANTALASFNAAMGGIESGEVQSEYEIRSVAARDGWSQAQIDEAIASFNAKKTEDEETETVSTETSADILGKIESGEISSVEELEADEGYDKLTEEDKLAVNEKLNTTQAAKDYYDSVVEDIEQGPLYDANGNLITASDIRAAGKQQGLSETQINDLIARQNYAVWEAKFEDENAELPTMAELDEAIKNGELTEAQKKQLISDYKTTLINGYKDKIDTILKGDNASVNDVLNYLNDEDGAIHEMLEAAVVNGYMTKYERNNLYASWVRSAFGSFKSAEDFAALFDAIEEWDKAGRLTNANGIKNELYRACGTVSLHSPANEDYNGGIYGGSKYTTHVRNGGSIIDISFKAKGEVTDTQITQALNGLCDGNPQRMSVVEFCGELYICEVFTSGEVKWFKTNASAKDVAAYKSAEKSSNPDTSYATNIRDDVVLDGRGNGGRYTK